MVIYFEKRGNVAHYLNETHQGFQSTEIEQKKSRLPVLPPHFRAPSPSTAPTSSLPLITKFPFLVLPQTPCLGATECSLTSSLDLSKETVGQGLGGRALGTGWRLLYWTR